MAPLLHRAAITRDNKFKLVQHHCHYDSRKYNFILTVLFQYGTVCLILSFLYKLFTPLKTV